jgi:hypothetical protein
MKNDKIEKYSKKLDKIINSLNPNIKDDVYPNRLISRSSTLFQLYEDNLVKFNEIIKELLQKEKWSLKFSEKFLDNKLLDIIANVLTTGNSTYQLFDELFNFYESYNLEYTVLLPLSGIELDVDKFEIGKITIINVNDKYIDNLANTISNSISKTVHNNDKRIQKQKEIHENLNTLNNKVCSIFKIVAEPGRAHEIAKSETNRALELLKYSIPSIYQDHFKVAVGFESEVENARLITPVISSDCKHFTFYHQLRGPLKKFSINNNTIERMKKIGVNDVSIILKKDNDKITDFEDVILRGIHWLSNSINQDEIENSFINLIICLETYFTPRDNDPIGTAIAEAVAIIIGSNMDAKRKIKKRIKHFYKKRSGISHGGKNSILESENKELLIYAGESTMWMISNIEKFNSIKDLLSWVEEKKFGSNV